MHSIEAEQSVLGALMLDNATAYDVFAAVAAGDFYRDDHATIFRTLQALHDGRQPMDAVTVSEHLKNRGVLGDVGGLAYVGTLANDTPSAANAVHYAKTVREMARRREIVRLCSELANAAKTADADDLAARLTEGLEAATRSASGQAKCFAEALTSAERTIREAAQHANGVVGIPSGLPALDRALGGFRTGRLYGLSARPGTGKTALLNQIGFHAARRGRGGLIFSLEMGEDELTIRAMASHAQVNVTRLFSGRRPEADAAFDAMAKLGELPLWMAPETYSLAGILSQAAYYRNRHGIEWIAVDHIGLVETEKFNTRNDQIGHITRSLKKLAKRLNIAVIALTQLSRNSERENRRPGLHDLRDSGNIEQDLDTALFLHCAPDDREKAQKPVAIGALKNRGGRVGWLQDTFEFDGATQTFRELAPEVTA